MDSVVYAHVKAYRLEQSLERSQASDTDVVDAARAAASQAARFQKDFPDSAYVGAARFIEFESLSTAARAGHTESRQQFLELAEGLYKSDIPDDEKFNIRIKSLYLDGAKPGDSSLEPAVRSLLRENPRHPETYWLLLAIAETSESSRRAALANELMAMEHCPDEVKPAAKQLAGKASSTLGLK